jgi:phytanoyl-CoA hydroxylase
MLRSGGSKLHGEVALDISGLEAAREDLTRSYGEDGYVALEGFFGPDAMRTINAEVERFIAERVPSLPREQVYLENKDDPTSIKQLQKLHEHDPFFRLLIEEGPVRRLAEIVLDGPVSCRNMQFFNKPAGVGQPTPPHQDGYYFHLQPCLAATAWLALEPVDEETGCIHYVRGSHKAEGFRPHSRTGTLGFSQGIPDFGTAQDKANDVAFPAQPGTLLIHDARTIHWAGGNRSPTRSRRALGFIFYSERATFDEASWAAYQARLAAELASAGRI